MASAELIVIHSVKLFAQRRRKKNSRRRLCSFAVFFREKNYAHLMGVRLSAVEKPFPHYVPVFDLCIERKVTLSENVYFMYLISNVCFHLHLLLNARVQVYNRKKRAPMKTLVCKWTQKNVRPSVVMSVCKKKHRRRQGNALLTLTLSFVCNR